ncbi:unnamed protein product [Spirodela intermedia]|uniref:IBH1-like N-terminal domain-containing protein n=1 Tax=Spirodela intermedia TaxID=51605 RepID=A0A7I8JLQ1_SPIIN|nr:unnamed protein product [Spirodela intermedia]CAA6671096.1 unnamed protein product [Spirodela intermedia]
MEETEGSKRLASFSHKFMAYLLPALFKVVTTRTCRGSKEREIEKIVRYEVDMALVVSASGFSWSCALKEKLERGNKDPFSMVELFYGLWACPLITRPLTPANCPMDADLELGMHELVESRGAGSVPSKEWKLAGGDEEVQYFVSTLRSILPGGEEMGVGELVSEVESYVVCLKMQVSLLQSLLDVQLGYSDICDS